MRSRPRAMLCDALVRRERGSCCVYLGVSMFGDLRDDDPRGRRDSAAAFRFAPSWPMAEYARARAVTMTGIKFAS
jgi:hypothetical protein